MSPIFIRAEPGAGGGGAAPANCPGGTRRSALVLLLAVVRFVPLIHGVFRRLHPLLLEELLELGQPHVGVLLFQARQIDFFKSREGSFHPALGMPVRIIADAAGERWGGIERETRIRDTSLQAPASIPLSSAVSATVCLQNSGDKAETPVALPLPASNPLHRTTGQGTCPVLAVEIESHRQSVKSSQFWGREGGNACKNFS